MFALWFTAEMADEYNSNLPPGGTPKPHRDVFIRTVVSGRNLKAPNGETFTNASLLPRERLNAAGVFPVEDVSRPDTAWANVVGTPTHEIDHERGLSVITYNTQPITVEEARRRMREKIKQARDEALFGGYLWIRNETESYVVETDNISQQRLSAAYNAARDGHAAAGMAWRMKDNSTVHLDSTELMHVALAVLGHVSTCYAVQAAREQELKTLSASDLEEYKTFDPKKDFPEVPMIDNLN